MKDWTEAQARAFLRASFGGGWRCYADDVTYKRTRRMACAICGMGGCVATVSGNSGTYRAACHACVRAARRAGIPLKKDAPQSNGKGT